MESVDRLGVVLMTKEEKDFVIRLVQMKYEAGVLGLWKTMHALEEPVTAVGWELAEQQEK